MDKLFLLALASSVAAAGCGPSIALDPGEGSGDTPAALPTAEFDPAHSIVPFPNNLALDPVTKKVNLPAQACESAASKAVREGVVNKLDGFGTYEATLTTTFTAMPDLASAQANVKLYALGTSGATEVPITILPGMAIRYADANSCATPSLVPELVIVPNVPLAQKSTYALAAFDTLTTADGTPFEPSATWVLTRSKAEPATFADDGTVTANHTPLDPKTDAATLMQLDGLWAAHTAALDAIDAAGHPREHVIVASTFTTATVTDTLDPMVAGSIGATDGNPGIYSTNGNNSVQYASAAITGPGQGGAALRAKLGDATCDVIGCDNVGDLLGAAVRSIQYQTALPNPGGASLPPIPGPFNDPLNPTEPGAIAPDVTSFIITPKTAMPPGGWPLVIFGHGLGSSKESLAVFGPQLAGQGFASIAIDFVESGSRAVRTSNTGNCADSTDDPPKPPDPTSDAGRVCYAQILSTDLAQTRDNIRQTVLDLRRLLAAMKKCGTGCGGPDGITFKVDTSKIFYTGISLGGIIGSTFVSLSPEVHAAVLDVPGVGLIDILENTQSAAIRCSLVDGLIDAGILVGMKSSAGAGALCIAADQGWKTQPGYQQFAAIARWVLDPADGGNYVSRLAPRKILVQEVVGDQVVPNIATDREAGVIGFTMPGTADKMRGDLTGKPDADNTPSAAVVAGSHQWVRYPAVSGDGVDFPGNDFQHASLLQPIPTAAGALGTARVQLDAISFLLLNGN